jgi:dihydrofolate synthase / folylpolyglutamate synthase
MQFDQALAYLLSLGHETLTIKLGLRNTETLLAALGNPERSYRAVQIAGTNGKGSTAAFLDSICRAAGIRSGLFTSPHLISITERIKVDGGPIGEKEFAQLTALVKEASEQLVARGDLQTLPTFFEQVTAIALLAFAKANVALAILETGLGGRLDSTTAARASTVAITSIAMDHQEYLGPTLAEIAAEKAAIIHSEATVTVAPQDPAALKVILQRCESVGVRPRLIASDRPPSAHVDGSYRIESFTTDGRAIVSFATRATTYNNVTLALRGRHQIDNAATAISLAEALREKGFQISHEAIVGGLETAVHAGRLQLWDSAPRFLFDGAHNPASMAALRAYLDEFVKQPITILFAAMRDKVLHEMIETLFPIADKIVLTTLNNPRAASIDELMAALPADIDDSRLLRASNVAEAILTAQNITAAKGVVCVTGSLHLIGEVQAALKQRAA